MRCLICGTDGIVADQAVCPNPACRASLESQRRDLLAPGTLLRGGAYRIEYALGRGGFGITYRAIHTSLHQPVAIKEYYPAEHAHRESDTFAVLLSAAGEADYRRGLDRFLREGRVLTRLNHPGIVRVRDLFEERGTAYLVMDLIPGHSLRQELAAQPGYRLPEERVRAIMGRLVSALTIVHAESVYHLDIKPENVLITPAGEAVLLDFGAAKQGYSNSESIHAFTAAYAPPELMAGGEVGPASDIYSMGVLLHELLTGERPPSAMARMLKDDWAPAETIKEPWRGVLRAALQLRRDRRPQDIRLWWRPLEERTTPGPVPPPPPPPPTPARTRLYVAGVAGAVLLGGLFWWQQRNGPDSAPTPTPTVTVTATASRPVTTTPRPPTSTPTVRPPTVTPPIGRTPLLSDDFSNVITGKLPTTSDLPASYTRGYVNGEYIIRITDRNYRSVAGAAVAGTFTATTIEVDARIVNPTGNEYVTLSCRSNEGANEYRLTVNPGTREFRLARWDGTTSTPLKDWTTNNAINRDTANRLAFGCIGNLFTVSINGSPVASEFEGGQVGQPGRYPNGRLVLGVGVFPNTNPGTAEARFDNLAVYGP